MKKKLPPLNWLRSFEVSARHLNFTQAAAELNLTQAAVSQQIKGLEAQLGVRLFKRLPRGLELSQEGRAYIPVVHQAIEQLAEATDELFGRGVSKPLVIKSNLVFFTTWLAPRFFDFVSNHPDVDVRFSSNIWVDDGDKEFDLDIRHGEGDWPDVHSDRLTWDELVPVCSPKMAGGREPPSSPDVLDDYTLLHVMGYRAGWGHWLNQAGFPQVDGSRGIRFDTLISAIEMAKAGIGIALGRSSLIAEALKTGELIAPFGKGIETNEAFYLVSPVKAYEHPEAATFRTWILEQARIERMS